MKWLASPLSSSLSARLEKFLAQPGLLRLVGTQSTSSFALLFSQQEGLSINKLPHLVIVPDGNTAKDLQSALRFFSPTRNVCLLPSFDVGLYSNLYPNHRLIAQRVAWLQSARDARPDDLFIATVEGLAQKTLPYQTFCALTFTLTTGQAVPDNLISLLNRLGYQTAPTVEDVGSYCSRGGILDIYSPAHGQPLRIELFGDTVESIRTFDLGTQLSSQAVKTAHIIPKRSFVF